MENNLISAIINVIKNPIIELKNYNDSKNRINNMGRSLEEYIKDIFSNSVNCESEYERMKNINNTFSYTGNQNNPPDAILKNGDAIEVKKIESFTTQLALNSSYPKAKIFSDSEMITAACKNCENWIEKDIIYIIGIVKNDKLLSLNIVYGIDYAASEEIYTRIKNVISDGVNAIPNVEFSRTKELGKVNRVDPLGITYLRIRGMWGIENPLKVFNYIYSIDKSKTFNLMAIINEEKYNTFKNIDLLEEISRENDNLIIQNVEIKTPDNPAVLKKAKIITFTK